MEKLLIKTLPPTLLQIFCEIFHISKVIVKNIVDPDENFWRELLSVNGLNLNNFTKIVRLLLAAVSI